MIENPEGTKGYGVKDLPLLMFSFLEVTNVFSFLGASKR